MTYTIRGCIKSILLIAFIFIIITSNMDQKDNIECSQFPNHVAASFNAINSITRMLNNPTKFDPFSSIFNYAFKQCTVKTTSLRV